jgi:hypothetical protein
VTQVPPCICLRPWRKRIGRRQRQSKLSNNVCPAYVTPSSFQVFGCCTSLMCRVSLSTVTADTLIILHSCSLLLRACLSHPPFWSAAKPWYLLYSECGVTALCPHLLTPEIGVCSKRLYYTRNPSCTHLLHVLPSPGTRFPVLLPQNRLPAPACFHRPGTVEAARAMCLPPRPSPPFKFLSCSDQKDWQHSLCVCDIRLYGVGQLSFCPPPRFPLPAWSSLSNTCSP